jgi:xylulokinase
MFVGIDLGTSLCKAVLLSDRGRVLADAEQAYRVRRTSQGEVSHDARDYLSAMAATVRACARAAEGREVAAIGVTAPAHYAVLVDENSQPLTRTLLASDRRPVEIAEVLAAELGASCFEHTYVQLSAGWTLPQLVFLSRQDPARWKRVRQILIAKDFVRAHLTGSWATDPSDAAGTALYDQRAREWWAPAVEAAGLRPSQLPPIRSATDVAGKLTAEWSRRLGLRTGIPVAVGATDTAAELVSVGAVQPGAAMVKIATTGTVVAVTTSPRPDPRLLTYPHAVTGRSYTLAATNTAGAALRWLREDVLRYHDNTTALDRRARAVPAGSDGLLFLPFLDGERAPYWDARLRGGFVGLSAFHTQGHLVRAVMEGVAFSLRSCRDLLAELGLSVRAPILSGGGVRNALWRSILVSVLGTTARRAEPQGPAIGAAILAAASVGEWRVAIEGLPAGRPRFAAVAPDRELARTYDGAYQAYVAAAAAMQTLSGRLYRHV